MQNKSRKEIFSESKEIQYDMLNAIENDSDINLELNDLFAINNIAKSESNDLKDGFIKELRKALIRV